MTAPAADTIVALSSGALPSGVAIVRISGPHTSAVLEHLSIARPPPRHLTLAAIRLDNQLIDTGLVAWMPAPHSFTGEDTAELQVHGSPAVVRTLLRTIAALPGVRLAEAGEFTRRAFLNGKLDLTEVEGLGDLIEAETETQRQQAVARLAGGVSAEIGRWRETLLDARAEIEARLDFSDESDVSDVLPDSVLRNMERLSSELTSAIDAVGRGRIVREGLRVALAGPPNVGKSSLLNALSRSDLAIVSDEPGTTRDVREVALDLGGRLVVLVDMAGLRPTDSRAEAEGVRRAEVEIARADLVLWLVAPDVPPLDPPPQPALWTVGTKADLGPVPAQYSLSVQSDVGVDELLAALAGFAAAAAGSGPPALVSRERDLAALQSAQAALDRFLSEGATDEIAAEHLRQASLALERLLGRIDTEHVLDRLFASFCIGK
ncbi:MAG: tRNA uridine-5-carboxymethylaminomethyl(34) synthesis GTPase MnmE [Devosia sp. 67-54]|uniref:tRNA uridine-5-carboxymethylaminomethyl(34) synthesis GTPase MnmE n=1 Tax=unclassified Devosia TaxID=196773 RepID=UPI0009648101|nr:MULTISPECIES: tRNA uridine-5-carboxymethylaminomethyl(34) synthesis GTPase MnmE [unclassified Devosia]MBN9305170.1 tRNA uridine-5-carboxymethylaminomethyl(34) synthesis GTPase MnmE [Devosia sp.]OJX14906.1 MAG: tRNA uridine-5-carboxymethylaminomethyl(34) synthesis GTPase MnmE [Devosia sp. 67-54]